MYRLLIYGGLHNGGFNFDTKVRRQSIDPVDMFYGHIGGIDVLAKSLLVANDMINGSLIKNIVDDRYAKWNSKLGIKIMKGNINLDDLANLVSDGTIKNIKSESGRQEKLENIVMKYIHK
jgi:xylose isomerase